MKRNFLLIFFLAWISLDVGYSASFLESGIMKNPIDNYSSLMYEANDALELSINPKKKNFSFAGEATNSTNI